MSNMVSLSDINSWMDASGGSATVVDTLGPQRLDTMPWDVYADSSDIWWQEQSIPHEKTQARNISEYPSEVNGITDLMLGAFGDTNGANRALIWQWDDDGTWAHAQVRVEHHLRDSYVHSLIERFLTEGLTLICRMTSLWPSDLPLVLHPAGISTLDLQRWIQKNNAPVSRMKCASETDDCDFINLVDALRKCRGVSLRNVSPDISSHALTVRDGRVGGRRQLSGTASSRAAWHGPLLCSVSCQRHPEPTNLSIAWTRPHEAPCGPELLDVVQTSAPSRFQ
jgi:hypothetical protein